MKKLFSVYVIMLFFVLTLFYYSGINRINEMKNLGTSDLN